MTSLPKVALFTIIVSNLTALMACSSGQNQNPNFILTKPTVAEIKTAISANNPDGIAVGKPLNPIQFPECTADSEINVGYLISNLPTWLSFNSNTRILTLASGLSAVPNEALPLHTVQYECFLSSEVTAMKNTKSMEASVEFVLNDLDDGGISDGYEFLLSRPPLVNRSFGWIWINKDSIEAYTTKSDFSAVPNGLNIKEGLNALDVSDEDSDFDADGISNLSEINSSTNIFVPTSSGTFGDATYYSVNTEPQGIDCADYNNDGAIDLAITNRASNNLSVLLGNGDGTFMDKDDTTQGTDPFGVISADFDDNGLLDLAITNSADNDLSVRLGNGDGTFGTNTDYPVGTSSRYIYATTDFNNDDNLDLALTNAGDDNVAILFGNGDGSFDPPDFFNVGDGPIGLIAADFDNDGDVDLAVADNHVTTISVLLNFGDGTFLNAVPYLSGTNPWGITAGDFNGDFIIDLAATNYNGGNLSVFLGLGDGTFGDAVSYITNTNPNMMVSGDFNGDGAIDLASSCRENGGGITTGQISVLLGVGDGTFQNKVDYPSTGDAINLCTADFNKDNILDLAAVNYASGNVSILLGQN